MRVSTKHAKNRLNKLENHSCPVLNFFWLDSCSYNEQYNSCDARRPPKSHVRSKLTLDEFQEWFFRYIAVRYCTEAKASQKQPPNEVWEDGLKGDHHHTMGG
ncbi:MAG: hypothetical protein ACTSYI_08390 [Promethearchaeota archaeon]